MTGTLIEGKRSVPARVEDDAPTAGNARFPAMPAAAVFSLRSGSATTPPAPPPAQAQGARLAGRGRHGQVWGRTWNGVDFQNMRIYDRMDIAYPEAISASMNWLRARAMARAMAMAGRIAR